MKTTLVIMAAGIGSRFGGGIKQLEPVGQNGEIIIDYSIHDAIEAGFDKIIFIIRKDIEADFKEVIGDRIEKVCAGLGVEIAYAFQDPDDLPNGIKKPAERTKPWGTGHAVLACRDILNEPFAVINADDYYGKEAFVKIHDFLMDYTPQKGNVYSMAGFIMKNTLSDNGGVTRGVCKVNENNELTGVDETSNIVKTSDGAAVDRDGVLTPIDDESYVSMNMWGLTPEYMELLKEGFVEFFERVGTDECKAEYLLPIHIDGLLQAGKISVKVLDTQDKWFGVTYKEDKEIVVASFAKLLADGVYKDELFSDLAAK
ncbi:MAG: nucleotidyltransferase [Lachnospiraceae bacterium]|nr:nucleotidyltransferase [Lachnospiraceae bacterium]